MDIEKERAAEQTWESSFMELSGCTESQARNVFMYLGCEPSWTDIVKSDIDDEHPGPTDLSEVP